MNKNCYPSHFLKLILMIWFIIISSYAVGAGLSNNIDLLPRSALAKKQIGTCTVERENSKCTVYGIAGIDCYVPGNRTVYAGSKAIVLACQGKETISPSQIEKAVEAYVKTLDPISTSYKPIYWEGGEPTPAKTNCSISPSSLTIEYGQLQQKEINGNQIKKEFNVSCTNGAADITISLGKEQSGMSVTDINLGGGIFSNLSTSSKVHVNKNSSATDYITSRLSAPSLIKAGKYSGSTTLTFNWN